MTSTLSRFLHLQHQERLRFWLDVDKHLTSRDISLSSSLCRFFIMSTCLQRSGQPEVKTVGEHGHKLVAVRRRRHLLDLGKQMNKTKVLNLWEEKKHAHARIASFPVSPNSKVHLIGLESPSVCSYLRPSPDPAPPLHTCHSFPH